MNRKTIGLAMCGSFCTFARVLDAFSALDREQYDLVPIQSQAAYATDTRFGAAADFRARLEALCGRPIIHTIEEAEPIGPKKLLDVLVIAPCTARQARRRHRRRPGHPRRQGPPAQRAPDRPRRLDQRRSCRQRREPRRASEPPRLLFRPLRPGQRHQKAPFPRRRLPPAPRRPLRRPARPAAPADALRGEDVTGAAKER